MSFSIDEITMQLGGPGAAETRPTTPPPPCPQWLIESWQSPRAFFAALCEHAAARSEEPPKSRYGEGYDLYNDFVGRPARLAPDRAALRYLDGERGLRSLSFGELHARAGSLAAEWAGRKIGPKAVVAIVAPPGPALCVALATALRLGALACFIAPAGATFVQNRVAGLKPTHVFATRDCLVLCTGCTPPPLLLPDPILLVAEPWDRSHTYAPKEPALRVISPLRDPPHQALVLGSEAAYCHALRDGTLLFGLRPGDLLCAPGASLHQHLPALLLAAWASGAGYLHCSVRDVVEGARPSLFERCPPRVLLVSTALRDALRQLPQRLPAKSLGLWLRNPEEPFEYYAWQEFLRGQELAAVPHANLVVDAAAGGALLFSPRRAGFLHPEVWPAPGCEFALLQPGTKEQAALGGSSLFSPKPPGDKPHPGHMMLLRSRGGYQYGGTLTQRRAGHAFPAAEICALLDPMPPLLGTAVVPLHGSAPGEQDRFALVLFTGGPIPDGLVEEAGARVRVQLGEEAVPDRVLAFPLVPRRKAGAIDTAWVLNQLLRGLLLAKAREPAFRALTALRRAVRVHVDPNRSSAAASGAASTS